MLTAGGIYLSVITGGVQFRHFFRAVKYSITGEKREKRGGVSSFQAMCTALAGTVGTGNIIGVAIAIKKGGPGAVFWMWICAFIGMATKYAEILMSVRYREIRDNNGSVGGPMYYMRNGLGDRWHIASFVFCAAGMAAALTGGNMIHVGSITDCVSVFADGADLKYVFMLMFLVGIAASLLSYVAIKGGAVQAGKISAVLVPVMAALYIAGMVSVIWKGRARLAHSVISIFRCAFSLKALKDGAAGGGMLLAMSWGMRRGIFSNEAGLGSAPMAYASSESGDMIGSGLMGIFEVFVDTIVICTLTALAILVTEADGSPAAMCVSALKTVFGEKISEIFMAFAVALFASSSIVSWSVYGERCAQYLTGDTGRALYCKLFVAVSLISPCIPASAAISAADAANALMAIPNIMAIIALSPQIKMITDTHLNNKAGSKTPRLK